VGLSRFSIETADSNYADHPRRQRRRLYTYRQRESLVYQVPKKIYIGVDTKALVLAKGILKKTWGLADFRLRKQTTVSQRNS